MSGVTPPALGASDGPEAIGRRIEVFWPEDDTWYGGRVAEFNATSGEHKIRYDDGDVELIALSTETFRWGTEPAAKRSEANTPNHTTKHARTGGGVGGNMLHKIGVLLRAEQPIC